MHQHEYKLSCIVGIEGSAYDDRDRSQAGVPVASGIGMYVVSLLTVTGAVFEARAGVAWGGGIGELRI